MKNKQKTVLGIGIGIFVLYLCVHYIDNIAEWVSVAVSALTPLVLGLIIAYILNILMSFYERHYFPNSVSKAVIKSRRAVCMLASFLTLLSVIALVVGTVIPELISCLKLLVEKAPESAQALIESKLISNILSADTIDKILNFDWQSYSSEIKEYLISGISGTVGTVASIVSSVASSVASWAIGLIFAIYFLADKEKLKGQCNRLLNSYVKPKYNKKIKYVLSVFNNCFHKYIVGQCTEAVILGCLCIVGMLILRIPYSVMIGVFVGFTALIPIAGAYIGAGVGAFMILSVSPTKAVVFLIFIIVLQQIEGKIIYPKVVGNSIGLPGLWVLAAVTVGGSIFGIKGMLLGVPTAASIYRIVSHDVNKKEKSLLKAEKCTGINNVS